jgi:cobalt-zinc-cadmium resistance protein CzcA
LAALPRNTISRRYPERLASLGVTLQDIVTALDRNNGNVGAGYIEKRGEQYLIRAPGQVKTLEDIGNVILSSAGGVPIRVRDVAEVGIGRELRTGAATDNGREVVLGTVFMLIGQNSRTVSQAVDKKMVEINRSLPEGARGHRLRPHRPGGQGHQHGEEELVGRCDPGDRDPVPVPGQHPRSHHHGNRDSLVDAVYLHGHGEPYKVSANLMSLGALDFGIIIDGAVVIVENCVRRLAHAQAHYGGH